MSHFLILPFIYPSTNLGGVRVGRRAVSVDGEAAEDPAAVAGDRAGVGAARGVLHVDVVSRDGTAAAYNIKNIHKNVWEYRCDLLLISRLLGRACGHFLS